MESPKDIAVKAIANSEYAKIRIDFNQDEQKETLKTVTASDNTTKVTVTVTSQEGVPSKHYLYVKVTQNNSELDKVIVEDKEITNYSLDTHTYVAAVDAKTDTYKTTLIAVDSSAEIKIFDDSISNEAPISGGEGRGSITDLMLTLINDEDEHSYRVRVSLDETNYTEYTLYLTKMSNDTSLKVVEVNDVARTPEESNKNIYVVNIAKIAETAKIRVETTNKGALVQVQDSDIVKREITLTLENLELDVDRFTVPAVVRAVDGETVDTFNIILQRQSNSTDLEYVKVNEEEITKIPKVNEDERDQYIYYMKENEIRGNVEISSIDNAKIELINNEGAAEKEGIGYLDFVQNFEIDTIKVEKTIKVTSEDETKVEYYDLILVRQTEIRGKIITENYLGKHSAKVKLYKEEKDELGKTTRTFIKEVDTKVDGSYVLEVDSTGTYTIVYEKAGNLSHEITGIVVKPLDIIEKGEYKLIAGDIVASGEIELDDLVMINEHIGRTITEENKGIYGIYDLNEDGKIDEKDRQIIRKNYCMAE